MLRLLTYRTRQVPLDGLECEPADEVKLPNQNKINAILTDSEKFAGKVFRGFQWC